jgi:hypothetical protein
MPHEALYHLRTQIESLIPFVRACKRGDLASTLVDTMPTLASWRSGDRRTVFRRAFGEAMDVLNVWAGYPEDGSNLT